MQDIVPEAGRVADRRLVPNQNPLQLLFDPGRRPVHDVDVTPGLRVDPLVARLPEVVAHFAVDGEARRDGYPIRHGDR
jgi:hypothetical protein